MVLSLFVGALYVCVSVEGTENPGDADSHLEQGVESLRAGQFQAASEEFKVAIRQNPQLVQAYVYLGIAENELGQFTDAVPVFRDALKLDQGSEAAHYNLALSLLSLKKTDEAMREFRAVVQINPKNGSANYNLGLLLAQEGSFKKACEYLERARSAQPGDPAILINLTDLYLKTGNEASALKLIREGTELDSDGTLSMQLGKLLVDKDHFKEALPILERARSLLPAAPEITGYLARAYLGASQPAKVIELLAPIRENEASWEVYYLRGLAFKAMGQRDEAVQVLSRAISMQPGEASLHYDLGKLLLNSEDMKGRKAGAYEVSEAIKLAPNKGEYYLGLASFYFDAGNLNTTIELLKSALDRVPPTVEIYVTLGLAELELHGPTPAQPYIEKAIALDPHAGAGYDLLGRCRMRLDDYADAAKYYIKAAKLTPGNDIYFRDAAIALDKLGNSSEGLPFAEQSVKLRPSEVYNHYILGKLFSQTGHRADAIRELERCVSLDGKNSLPYNLLATLYKRAGEDGKAENCWRTLRALKQEGAEKTQQTFSRLGSVPQ